MHTDSREWKLGPKGYRTQPCPILWVREIVFNYAVETFLKTDWYSPTRSAYAAHVFEVE